MIDSWLSLRRRVPRKRFDRGRLVCDNSQSVATPRIFHQRLNRNHQHQRHSHRFHCVWNVLAIPCRMNRRCHHQRPLNCCHWKKWKNSICHHWIWFMCAITANSKSIHSTKSTHIGCQITRKVITTIRLQSASVTEWHKWWSVYCVRPTWRIKPYARTWNKPIQIVNIRFVNIPVKSLIKFNVAFAA